MTREFEILINCSVKSFLSLNHKAVYFVLFYFCLKRSQFVVTETGSQIECLNLYLSIILLLCFKSLISCYKKIN